MRNKCEDIRKRGPWQTRGCAVTSSADEGDLLRAEWRYVAFYFDQRDNVYPSSILEIQGSGKETHQLTPIPKLSPIRSSLHRTASHSNPACREVVRHSWQRWWRRMEQTRLMRAGLTRSNFRRKERIVIVPGKAGANSVKASTGFTTIKKKGKETTQSHKDRNIYGNSWIEAATVDRKSIIIDAELHAKCISVQQ